MGLEAKRENFLNECKGNLFEYLVGSFIARNYQIEEDYISSLGSNFLNLLSQYELQIRRTDRELLKALPELALKTSQVVINNINHKIDAIYLVGKTTGASHDQRFTSLLWE